MLKENNNWRRLFIRKNCDLPTDCGIIYTACKEIWNITKIKKEYLFGVLKNKNYYYYIKEVDERQIGRRLYKKRYPGPSEIILKYQEGKNFLKSTSKKTALFKKLLKRDINPSVFIQALKAFQKDFNYVNFNYSISPWWALEAWQHDFEDMFLTLINQRGLMGRYDEIIYHLLKPWKPTALRLLGKELSRGVPAARLLKKYQFLRSWTVIWSKPITLEYINNAAEEKGRFYASSRKQIIKLLRPNRAQAKFIKIAPYIIFFKDWRDDLRRKQVFEWSFIFEGVAKYLNLTIDDIGYLTIDEMKDYLRHKNLNINLIKERRDKGALLTVSKKTSEVLVLPITKKYLKFINQAELASTQQQVKGISAQAGRIRGYARIINTYHDLKKVEKGEIFISNTTHPDYLVGMKKAAAFVTDEGGITSHAAIVARELKIPCVVGTKIATKVFKDGDLVEVDADKGVVKKL